MGNSEGHLAYAALEDLEIESIDISSAFLNGEIDSEIYMQQPEGFPQGSPDQVLRLVKSIYGMKQSPRLWHQKLDQVLSSLGFVKIKSDASVWVFQNDGIRVIVSVYVDDMTLVSKSKSKLAELKAELRKHFKLRDLGPIEFLLGVRSKGIVPSVLCTSPNISTLWTSSLALVLTHALLSPLPSILESS